MTTVQVNMIKPDNAAMETILGHAANFQGSFTIEPFYNSVAINPDGSPDCWWIEYTYGNKAPIRYSQPTLSEVLHALAKDLSDHWNKVYNETNT